MTGDQWGALPVPIPIPTTDDQAIGDPLIDYTLSFFAAVLNADAGDAWRKIAASDAAPVLTTVAGDPKEIYFNEDKLPALFAYRSDSKPSEWIASDWEVSNSTLCVLWLMPRCSIEQRRQRLSLLNAVPKVLERALERGYHPAWVASGDTDKGASYRGSTFHRWAGFVYMNPGRWRLVKVPIAMRHAGKDKPEPLSFDAVEMLFDVQERLTNDELRRPGAGPTAGMNITIQTADTPPLVIESTTLA